MSDSLIVAAEGSAPYKLLEDAGRGILTAEALTSALKNGVPAATCDDSSESLLTKCSRAHLNYEPSATPAAVEAK